MVQLRRAANSDVDLLTALSKRAFYDYTQRYSPAKEGGPPGYDSRKFQLQMINKCNYYCICLDNTVIGGLIFTKKDAGHYELIRMFISPEYQNRGIGRDVIKLLDGLVPDAKKWILDTPDWAVRNQHFYESLGFKKVKEEYDKTHNFALYLYERNVGSSAG